MFLGGRIGDQTIGFIPAQFTNRTHGARLSLPIPLLTNRISEGGFQLCAIAKRFDELQHDNGGSAIRILGRHTEAEVFSPVDEGPPRYALEESVRSLSLEEPIQDSSLYGELVKAQIPGTRTVLDWFLDVQIPDVALEGITCAPMH